MTEEVRKLLEDLRHDLMTMNGMGAFDQGEPNITFTVDNRDLIQRTDRILGVRLPIHHSEPSLNYGSNSQYLGDPEDWKKEHEGNDISTG